MKKIALVAGLAVSASLTTLAFQATPQKPTFRVRVELMQLDVTVLDKNGQPVRGLTKEDFQLFEDDKPQSIESRMALRTASASSARRSWRRLFSPARIAGKVRISRPITRD